MNTTFTTINGTTFTANETMTHCYCWPKGRKGERVRIKKAEFEAAQREDELERKMAAEAEKPLTFEELQTLAMENYNNGGDGIVECWDERTFNDYVNEFGPITKEKAMEMFSTHEEVTRDFMGYGDPIELVLTENDNMVTITPEDIERDARELERYIEEAEESNTDLEVAEIAEQMLDAAAEDPKVSLEEFVEKVEKVEKAKKTRKSKDIAFTYTVNGEVIVTLTAKQVDFIKHLPDTCFWEHGLDSCIWIDCLCDEIKGQFAGKPMTVGAMISTICEKKLGIRADNRVNGKKCKSFSLTELGKQVFASPEWGLN